MAGRRGPVAGALRYRLYLWLCIAIVGVAVVAGGLSFAVAFFQANELQDDLLRQMASLVNSRNVISTASATTRPVARIAPEDRVVIRRLGAERSAKHAPPPYFSSGLAAGLHVVSTPRGKYRVLIKTLGHGERVAVAQQTAVRDEKAARAALDAVLPSLAGLPILLLAVGLCVRKLFAPVTRIANDLDRRGEGDLSQVIDPDLPAEVQPFVDAINRLLGRVGELIAAQHRFIAAAAHELRTPLAALSLQAERLEGHTGTPTERRQKLRELRQAIDRNQSVVGQLLSLARTRVPSHAPTEACSANTAIRDAVTALLPLADAKQIELSIDAQHTVAAYVIQHELDTVLNNLIGNAIRYTPPGGAITITLDQQRGLGFIEVEDSGPGLSDSEKERVKAAFYRLPGASAPGAGLGLAIVCAITENWRGQLRLSDAKRFATGLVARVTFTAGNGLASGQDNNGGVY